MTTQFIPAAELDIANGEELAVGWRKVLIFVPRAAHDLLPPEPIQSSHLPDHDAVRDDYLSGIIGTALVNA